MMNIKKVLGYGILSFMFVAVGCDSLTNPSTEEEQEIFTITNDVAERTVDYNSTAKSQNIEASADATDYLDLEEVINTPTVNGNKTTASHLSINNGNVYAGYKVMGAEYGGGIDIIDADNGNRDETARAFQSIIFDVQEVIEGDGEGIFVAGAQRPLKEGDPKSWVLKLDSDANVQESTSLTGNVAKSVDTNDESVYAVSDYNQLYRFDYDLGSENVLNASGGVEFRSVGARFQDHVLTLDLNGNVRRTQPSFNGFNLTEELTSDSEFDTELGIARLNYFNHNNPNFALVALNSYGLAILNPSGQSVWSEENGKHYFSATGLKVSNNESYVFAAASTENGQYIDVFDTGPGFQNPNSDLIISLNLNKFDGLSDEPVNHAVATENHLFVAKGEDGVLIFDIDDLDDFNSGNKGGKGGK